MPRRFFQSSRNRKDVTNPNVKKICCDTSFLISFYGKDSLSGRTVPALAHFGGQLSVSVLNCYEFEQGVHFLIWRKKLSYARGQIMKGSLESDCATGLTQVVACNVQNVLTKARRLSAVYTETSGYRSMDILLVANALELGAEYFLSFDNDQRKLAQAEGLKLNP
jgi:predicted nucleic acid-binding protein